MASRRRGTFCHCSYSLHLSSAILFLSAILPSSSLAQLLTDPTSTNPPFTSGFPAASSNPATTLQTSTLSPPSSTTNPSPTPAQSSPPVPTTTPDNDGSNNRNNMFNYYFVIVAVVAIMLVLAVFYIGKRKKQKAAMLRSNSRAASARDVEGFRNRFGMGRAAMRRAYAVGGEVHTGNERTEGLNERGEAPPPYNPGSKPPSIRTNDGIDVREVSSAGGGVMETVELNTIAIPRQDPPQYHEETNAASDNETRRSFEGDADVARPATAVTAPPARTGSLRSFRSQPDTPAR